MKRRKFVKVLLGLIVIIPATFLKRTPRFRRKKFLPKVGPSGKELAG